MKDSIKLPVTMSVDQMLELMRKSNGQIVFTISLAASGDASTKDSDFEGEPEEEEEYDSDEESALSEDEDASEVQSPSWWKKVEEKYPARRKTSKSKRKSKLDRALKFRKNKLRIHPVTGYGSRQALWLCPISNFPDNVLSANVKDAMQACGLNTVRQVTILKDSDIRNKLIKLGTYTEETCDWMVKEIKLAFRLAGLKLFYNPEKPNPDSDETSV